MRDYKSGQIVTECNKSFTWYSFGNPNGKPILFLHGGPGSGFNHEYIDIFGPALKSLHFITFDQRGSGNSQGFDFPHENNTQLLLSDIENLREHLGVDRWAVSGHSWGATLALLYAQKHSEQCESLFLAGTFLGRKKDQDWTFRESRSLIPDIFLETDRALADLMPDVDKYDSLESRFLDCLKSGSSAIRLGAARLFSNFSQYLARLSPKEVPIDSISEHDVNRSVILLSFAAHDFFINPIDGAVTNLNVLRSLPISFFHGEKDIDCPIDQIKQLLPLLPHARLFLMAGAHSLLEEPMRSGISQALLDSIGEFSVSPTEHKSLGLGF